MPDNCLVFPLISARQESTTTQQVSAGGIRHKGNVAPLQWICSNGFHRVRPARITSQILMSEAWKGYYNGSGSLCKCSFKEFLKKCGFDMKLALISLRKHYPCLLVKFSEALKMTPEERGRLGSEARWHSSADDSYEVDEGQVKVTDKVLRLNRQVEEGNLQAQELLDRIKASSLVVVEDTMEGVPCALQ